ncbi:DUF4405 domain-containing protein [Roseovarius indicus]|uniref:Flavinylation-associated cytochrome domain-containing protein n=1 Tax=Roseovarius indicus TaxID=540747 RepID=A0A0T5P5Y2_9RHOB|nr:DUF4405 domain-containing protein [Roseovarius indicus]KRS16534.1 hypothetical protein XM52_18275 [Roseovarius indicus]QEW28184.1 hypothetical protein RIdsm_04010 [Roseovarius indicus]SFE55893.1 protein of unknown function [Roseovarius indicus]
MTQMRKWATPLTMGVFLLMAVTGILMFFHLDMGLNKAAHEWLGWVMVAGVGAHLAVNARAFLSHLRKPLARGIMGAMVAVLALSFVPMAGAGGSPVSAVMQAVERADVGTVIALSGQEEAAGLARLAEAGFVAEAGMPMQVLTGGDRGVQAQVIGVLFAE